MPFDYELATKGLNQAVQNLADSEKRKFDMQKNMMIGEIAQQKAMERQKEMAEFKNPKLKAIHRIEEKDKRGSQTMKNCHSCGVRIPDNQGSDVCSMCYGDIDHGKDGYARREWERQDRLEQEKREYEQRMDELRAKEDEHWVEEELAKDAWDSEQGFE